MPTRGRNIGLASSLPVFAVMPNPLQPLFVEAERVAKLMVETFGVEEDEAAVLIVTHDEEHLRFASPRRLAGAGTIPINHPDSIATRALTTNTGNVNNHVVATRHVASFENLGEGGIPLPIQKMMTAPMTGRGGAIGVLQVSRKGGTPDQSGPDFTKQDLARLASLALQAAEPLAAARPDTF